MFPANLQGDVSQKVDQAFRQLVMVVQTLQATLATMQSRMTDLEKKAASSPAPVVSTVTPIGNLGGDLSGTADNAKVVGIQQNPIAGTAPSTSDVLQWDGSTWKPSAVPSAPVASVFGRTGAVLALLGDYTTTIVAEGTNLYFTSARAQAAMAGLYQTPISGAPSVWPTIPAGQVNSDWNAVAGLAQILNKPTIPTIPVVIGFVQNDGSTGVGVGATMVAPRSGLVNRCKLVVKASDGITDLTFTIKQNGTAVFLISNTVAHGATAGAVSTFINLTSTPLTITADDVFTLDISSGGSAWKFTVQLE